ncbi:MAG: HEAT repeat domain-containing protein [Acidobacteriota bacterium]
MVRVRSLMENVGAARMLSAVVALVLAMGGPLAADAQSPAADRAPAATGALFSQPVEQGQPGSAELSAGRVAVMNSQWQQALDHFRTVMSDYPDGELADDASYWAAKSLYELGRYEDAVAQVNEMITRYPQSTLLSDARIVRVQASEALVRRGNADYERYLRQEAAPSSPTAPRAPRAPQAQGTPPAPTAPNDELRLMALDALIGMDPEAAWPVLQRLVDESDDPEMRSRAVWLLSQMGTDQAFDLLLQIARTEDNPEVRGNALFWIGQSEAHADQALDLLIEVVNSGGNPEYVGQALFGLGQSDSPRAREALETLARDTTKPAELRGQALFWLGQREQGESIDLLRDILLNDPDEELRGQALFAISQIDTPEATEVLQQLARSDAPIETRSNAIFWLGQRAGEGAIDVMLQLWDEVDNIEVKNQILFALSQTDTDRAIDHLASVAKDTTADPELRQQAVFWLGQSENPKAKAALLEIIGGGHDR